MQRLTLLMRALSSDGLFLSDSFILNQSLMRLGKNQSSQGVIHSVAHAQRPIGSVLELVHLFRVFRFVRSSRDQ